MFTGIVEEIGTIESVQKGLRSAVLNIRADKIMEDIHDGDSIAVNGVCLTVISFSKGIFSILVVASMPNRHFCK